MSNGKLSYEVEFTAKGIEEVQARAQVMKAGLAVPAAGGGVDPFADLRKGFADAIAQAKAMEAAQGQVVAGNNASGASFGRMAGAIGGAIAALGMGIKLLNEWKDAVGDAIAAQDQMSISGGRSAEGFRERAGTVETKEDKEDLDKDLQRRREDLEARISALRFKDQGMLGAAGRWGQGARNWAAGGSFSDSRGASGKEADLLQQELDQLNRVDQFNDKRQLGPDQSSLDRLKAAREGMSRGDLFRGEDTAGQIADLKTRLEAAAKAYDELEAAATKAANASEAGAKGMAGKAEAKAREINQMRDQLAALEQKSAPNAGALERIRQADEGMKEGDLMRGAKPAAEMAHLQEKIDAATAALPALRDAAMEAGAKGSKEADSLAAKYAQAAREATSLKDRLASLKEAEEKRQFKLNHPEETDRLIKLGLDSRNPAVAGVREANPQEKAVELQKATLDTNKQLVDLTRQMLARIGDNFMDG